MMKTSAIILRMAFSFGLLAIHSIAAGQTPSFTWAQRGGGSTRDYAVAAAIDPAGNSFLGARVLSLSSTFGGQNLSNSCLVVAKYNPTGSFQWSVEVTPDTNIRNLQLGTDQAGNCYAAGYLTGSIIIGNSNLVIGPANADLFLAKFSPEGNLLWAKTAGAGLKTNSAQNPSLSVGPNGDCLLTGFYSNEFAVGTNTIGFPGALIRPFVVRCSSGGDWLWARDPCDSTNSFLVFPTSIVGRPNGEYFLGGNFENSVTFGNQVLTNSNLGTFDFFLIKCDPTGNVVWAKSAHDCTALSLAAGPSGDCYVLGSRFGADFGGSVSIDGCVVTNAGMFLVRFDSSGNPLWCRNPADLGPEPLLMPGGTWRLAIDAAEQLYVAGYFYGTAELGNLTITSQGGVHSNSGFYNSSFLAKYDPAGTAVWAKTFGGAKPEYPYPIDFPHDKTALAVNAEGKCCIVGVITITNAPFDNFVLATAGGEDAFIAQLSPEPPKLGSSRNGADVVISWPTNQPSFLLEQNSSLAVGSWSAVTHGISTAGIHNFLTNSSASNSLFFRLRKP